MNVLKFFLLWLVTTFVMVLAWSIGSAAGNAITGSIPPALDDPSSAGAAFLGVCILNGLLLSIFLWSIRRYSGFLKALSSISYVFVIQFLLTQMETMFFSDSIQISGKQITSIVIAGLLMSSVTVFVGLMITNKITKGNTVQFQIPSMNYSRLLWPVLLLIVVIYPTLYLVFGYYVAWQNENLRVFYSQSSELKPFFLQTSAAFGNGIYFFQTLRGFIWVAVCLPIVLMLQYNKTLQYILVALLSALLPADLLFIPNPFMPMSIAMTHFVETSTSNFIWGLVITFVLNKYVSATSSDRLAVNSY